MALENELVTNFEFKGSLNPLNQYNLEYGNAISLMTKSIGIATAVSGALLGLSNSTLQVVDDLGQLSRTTGTSIEYLQELGYVASINGSSVQALENSISGLSKKIGEAAISGSSDFDMIGISVRDVNGQVKSTETVLEDLRKRFQVLSAQEQLNYAEKLGIDKSLIQTLNLTNEELERSRNIAKSFGVVSKQQADEVIAFNDSLTTLKFGFNAIGQQISLSFMPEMSNLSNSFTDLLINNKDLIKNGLEVFISTTGNVLTAIGNTGKGIYEFVDATVGMENALYALGGAMLFFNRSLLLNPITLITAGIAGLILLVDDLYVAFDGGKSVIKDFFGSFNIDIVERLRLVFMQTNILLKQMGIGFLQIGGALANLIIGAGDLGKLLGFDIDTSWSENMLKTMNETKTKLRSEVDALKTDFQIKVDEISINEAKLKLESEKDRLTQQSVNNILKEENIINKSYENIFNTRNTENVLNTNNVFNRENITTREIVPTLNFDNQSISPERLLSNVTNTSQSTDINQTNNINIEIKSSGADATITELENSISNTLSSAKEQLSVRGR